MGILNREKDPLRTCGEGSSPDPTLLPMLLLPGMASLLPMGFTNSGLVLCKPQPVSPHSALLSGCALICDLLTEIWVLSPSISHVSVFPPVEWGYGISGAQRKWVQSNPSSLVWLSNDSRSFQNERGNRKTGILDRYLDNLGVFFCKAGPGHLCGGQMRISVPPCARA